MTDDDIWYLGFHVLVPIIDLSFLHACEDEDEDGQQNDIWHMPNDPEEVARFEAWYMHRSDSE